MPLSTGARLGPYEILSAIGAGGMGEVYKARDTRLGRDVAIKVLPAGFAADPERRHRFELEARAVSALSHPHICVLFDVGSQDGIDFLVMEYLDGQSLAQRLRKGALPRAQVLEIGAQVADALASAHRRGIVHRDLKPANIMLTKSGAKLLDFGLAKLRPKPGGRVADVSALSTQGPATSPGAVMGTVPYMAPEQLEGKETDARTDLFALGCVLYEMLTARRAFGGDSEASVISAIMTGEPPPLSTLQPLTPPALDRLVRRCLKKDPDDRWESARDVAEELRGISQDAVATDGVRAVMPRARRRGLVWSLAAGAAVVAALALFVGLRFMRSGAPPAQPVRLTLSFPIEAPLFTGYTNTNPLALSPDGKTLVYMGGAGTDILLFARRLDRGDVKPIPGTAGSDEPFFSADGLEVGFFTTDGKLKKVALAGGVPITLCDVKTALRGSWGPDGTILFTPGGVNGGLWRIPSSGGEPRAVTTLAAGTGGMHMRPQILPDGEHVLFTISNRTRETSAAVVSLRTGEQRRLVERANDARYLPTGHLLFLRDGILFGVRFDPKRLEVSGAPVPLLDDVVTNSSNVGVYAVSQDGTLVYLPSRQPQRTLVWVDRRGAVEPTPFPPGGYQLVALSPDARRLAVISTDQRETQTLSIGDFARGGLSRSTTEGRFESVCWTRDGTRVALAFAPAGKSFGAFWQNADLSTPPERLTSEQEGRSEWPESFSPDGRLLLTRVWLRRDNVPASGTMDYDLFVLPLSGARTLRPFLETKGWQGLARFSPDGRFVAYTSNESGRAEVFVRPFPGPGATWQVSTDGGGNPLWSPNGRELFYPGQGSKLMVVDVETAPTFHAGRPRVLLQADAWDYDIAPDGSRFLMIKPDPAESGETHVNVVMNWFEEVKAKMAATKR